MNAEQLTGIEYLRNMVEAFNGCREDFLDSGKRAFSVKQLMRIYDCWLRSPCDVYPDNWSKRQIQEALDYDMAPDWDENERPVYKVLRTP
jgi:hypothetical protein